MSTVFYEKPGVVTCTLEGKKIIVKWNQMHKGDIVKECCLAQADKVQFGAKVIIVDVVDATGALPQETQDWLASTFFPKVHQFGVKAIITVLPKSALTKLTAKQWMSNGSPFGFEMFDAASLEDAHTLADSKI